MSIPFPVVITPPQPKSPSIPQMLGIVPPTVVTPPHQIYIPITRAPVYTVDGIVPSLFKNNGINDNYFVQKKVNDYIHDRFLKKWIYDFPKLFDYLKSDNGLIIPLHTQESIDEEKKKMAELKMTSPSLYHETIKAKVKYIKHHILTENKVKKILEKVLRESSIEWVDLPNNQSIVKYAIYKYIKKHLKE